MYYKIIYILNYIVFNLNYITTISILITSNNSKSQYILIYRLCKYTLNTLNNTHEIDIK